MRHNPDLDMAMLAALDWADQVAPVTAYNKFNDPNTGRFGGRGGGGMPQGPGGGNAGGDDNFGGADVSKGTMLVHESMGGPGYDMAPSTGQARHDHFTREARFELTGDNGDGTGPDMDKVQESAHALGLTTGTVMNPAFHEAIGEKLAFDTPA